MSRAGAAKAAGGFTLIELLVVLVLLGVLVAVAAPRFGSLAEPGLYEVGRKVVAELRLRRGEAMRSGRAVVTPAASLRLPPGFALLTERAEGAAGGADGVLFLPDGRSGGARLVLAHGSDRAEIVVDWLTGEVRLLR